MKHRGRIYLEKGEMKFETSEDGDFYMTERNEIKVFSDYQKAKSEKPTLGVVPKFIRDEQRLDEINEAIKRYFDAGKIIPEHWLREKDSLECVVKTQSAQPKKEVLFKTEDGVEIFYGDFAYGVGWLFDVEQFWCNDKAAYESFLIRSHKVFSSQEKANDYLLLNKPLLSVNDVINNIGGYGNESWIISSFSALAKEKQNIK